MIDYEVIKIDLYRNEIRVKYSKENKPDAYFWFNLPAFDNITEEFIHTIAKNNSNEAIVYWDNIDKEQKKSEDLFTNMSSIKGTAKPWIFEPIPEYDKFTHRVESLVVEEPNSMKKTWKIVELSDSQRGDAIRQKRNALLAACDLECIPDRNPPQELLDYREALRNISNQEGFPKTVIWPIKPSDGA